MRAVFLLLLALVTFSSAKLIKWTSAGGTPLWDFANNWDCLCVPTAADDVVIDLANIPGTVRIGSTPSFCNSLAVGGTSTTPQSLTVQNSLTIGPGGGKIFPNGDVILDGPPTSPISVAGQFDGGSKFTFNSGALGGTGSFSFANINLTGPALKVINTTVSVSGFLNVNSPTGSTINIATGQLQVTGTFKSSNTVTISSAATGKLNVPGSLVFSGGQTNVLTIRGTATIATFTVDSGTVTLNDNVSINTISVQSGATLNTIGSNDATRTIGDITGTGTLQIQGGTNSFSTLTNIGTVLLSGGSLNADNKPGTIATLQQSGGSITGKAALSITTAQLTNANIINTPITVATLTLNGFSSLDGSSLTVSTYGVIANPSQLTLANGANFIIAKTAQVSQSASLKLLPSGTHAPPVFSHDGKWTSTSDLQIVVSTKGDGAYQFGTGSTTSITGIPFNAGSMTFTSAKFTSTGSTVSIGTISGTGNIESQGALFVVTGDLAATTFSHANGVTAVATASVTNLDVQTGSFNITGAGITATNLSFEGGLVTGTPGATTSLTIGTLTLTGNQPKTFSDISVTVSNLSLTCGPQQCQLFTQNASVSTSKSSKGQKNVVNK